MSAISSGPDRDKYIQAGKISKPHGIKGEVRIYPYSGNPADFAVYPEIMIVSESGEFSRFKVDKSSVHGKVAIVKIAGINDRSSSEALGGLEVWVDREYLPALLPDEFFWHDLIGLEVVTESGRKLGQVRGLFTTGAHDVLVIKGSGREYLVPAKREFMIDIDQAGGLLTIAEVPGMLEMNG